MTYDRYPRVLSAAESKAITDQTINVVYPDDVTPVPITKAIKQSLI